MINNQFKSLLNTLRAFPTARNNNKNINTKQRKRFAKIRPTFCGLQKSRY